MAGDMLSILPDLSPRECHSLWYSSSRRPNSLPPYLDPAINPIEPPFARLREHSRGTGLPMPRATPPPPNVVERSLLGRLRADEMQMERGRQAVANTGCMWLKPPGVPKTLFQMREERREALEHAEAVRREELQQQLAEAEMAAAEAGDEGAEAAAADTEQNEDIAMAQEDDLMARDLDEEIPDADAAGRFGLDGASNEDESDEEDDSEGGRVYEFNEHRDGEIVVPFTATPTQPSRRDPLARVRETEDRMREMMARAVEGNEGDVFYGEEEGLTEQDHANLLEESDLAHEDEDEAEAGGDMEAGGGMEAEGEGGMDLDMDADLDAEIPEAGYAGGYEHTDSDASVSADDEGRLSISHFSRAPQASRYRVSMPRNNEVRNSVDISGLLSQDGSSMLGSSPQMRRQG